MLMLGKKYQCNFLKKIHRIYELPLLDVDMIP